MEILNSSMLQEKSKLIQILKMENYLENFTSFYENGNNQIITFYNNDLRMGSFEEFYENGRLKMCGNYSNGLKIGEFKEFFKSGGTATYNY